ncbi:MAG: SDR family NAD(P)-dependent oxidoreductase [Candidatus Nitrosopolaris sp.]
MDNIAKKGDLFLNVVVFDVNIDKSLKDAINRVLHENKKIDVIVNNAGYVLLGPLEHLSIKEIKAQFETKLFGVISDPGNVTVNKR